MTALTETEHLRASFVRETRDLLEQSGSALLALESDPGDEPAINALFRCVHSIKGSAGLFDLPALIHLVHAAEDLLGAMREGRVRLDPGATDDLLGGLDRVTEWIDAFEGEGAMDPTAMNVAIDFARRYRARLGQGEAKPAPAVAAVAGALPDWIDDAARAEILAAAGAEQDMLILLAYDPPEDCFFAGEDPLFLALQTPDMLWLRVVPRQPWAAEEFDPYACNLRFLLASAAPASELEHQFRYVREAVAIHPVRRAALTGAGGGDTRDAAPAGVPPAAGLPDLAVEILRTQLRVLSADRASPGFADVAAVVARVCEAASVACPPTLTPASDAEALRAAIEALLAAAAAVPPRTEDAAPADATAPSPRAARETAETAPRTGEPAEHRVDRTLRVEQSKVDSLMNLVGELVVAKNALPFLARDAETKFGSRELAREIKDKYSVIDRISKEMQNAVMDIRMLPVSELFKRFPRLVRDTARKLDKQVQLVIEGETTEADKNVIEALSEPLTHVLRNSLDHGIEPAALRAGTAKPALATITLRAYRESDQVVIEVEDDGRGIDPARVRDKAVAKGLIDEDRAAQMSDAQLVQLVFAPGFSTAEQVSDLSGRGVGMDAVRTVVEQHGGRVEMDSQAGVGTRVRLRLPLSMAVTRVLTIDLAGQLYGVPIEMVVETVRIDGASIRRLKAAEAIVLRDQVIPILRLRALLGMEPRAPEQESVLIVRIGHVTVGLVVDDFGTGMDIILKPFGGILADISGFAGTAVLGDGRVLLVLNLKEML